MYRNRKLLSIVAFILVCALAFVPVRKVNAFAPAAGVIYYAIVSVATAYGLYSMNKESMDYFVNEYWANSSDFTKKQWQYMGEYGCRTGEIVVSQNDAIYKSITQFIDDNFTAGQNTKYGPDTVQTVEGLDGGSGCKKIGNWELVGPVEVIVNGQVGYQFYIDNHNTCIWSGYRTLNISSLIGWGLYLGSGNMIRLYVIYGDGVVRDSGYGFGAPAVKVTTPIEVTIPEKYTYTGDAGGFGTALAPDQDVKVPCPPIPPAEWPERWLDDLEQDLNNTTADRYVETMDEDYDWYVDRDGHIYKKPKGEPPKKDDDTKLVPPIPPPYQPVHPEPGQPGPATPDQPWVPADPCPYCPNEPGPGPECPNPYCPNNPQPAAPPQYNPSTPPEPCPYCPPGPDPGNNPCPNPYCPNNPAPVSPPYPSAPPVPDDRYLDFEPLKKLPHIFTTKFPFSLPWDLKRGIESLEGGQWDRKFQIAACGNYWPEMTVDVSMFDPIAGITRVVFLIVFDFALIFATRRLMGGDV